MEWDKDHSMPAYRHAVAFSQSLLSTRRTEHVSKSVTTIPSSLWQRTALRGAVEGNIEERLSARFGLCGRELAKVAYHARSINDSR